MSHRICTLLLITAVATTTFSQAALGGVPTTPIGVGGWSYFSDPRALHHGGDDYVGWIGRPGRVQVWSRSHGAQTLARVPLVDDHAAPALTELPDGKLAAFWSPHGPIGSPDGMFYRVQTDQGGWGPVQQVSTNTPGRYGWSYVNPMRVGDELMLFWRGGNWQPTYSATRDGKTWSEAQTLLTGASPRDGRDTERPYAKYFSDGTSVHVAYTEAHPDRRRTSVFLPASGRGADLRRRGARPGHAAAGLEPR